MSDVTLSKPETALLVAAASAGGLLVIPDATKPATGPASSAGSSETP
jgi:hypothetical protein